MCFIKNYYFSNHQFIFLKKLFNFTIFFVLQNKKIEFVGMSSHPCSPDLAQECRKDRYLEVDIAI